MRNSLILILLGIMISQGCAPPTDTSVPLPHEKLASLSFTEVDTLTIHAGYMYNYDNSFGLSTNMYAGNENLISLSNDKVFRFNLDNGELLEMLPLLREGKGAIKVASDVDGIAMIDECHYLYSANMMNAIYSVKKDFASVVKQVPPDENSFLINSYQGTPLTVGNTSIFPQISYAYEDVAQGKSFTVIDHSNFKSREVIDFPEIYKKKSYSQYPYLYHAAIIDFQSDGELKFCVSFPADPSVYVYDSQFNLENSFYMKSNEIDEVSPFSDLYKLSEKPEQAEHNKYYSTLSYYTGLLYDRKNGIFYRIAKLHKPEKEGWPFGYSIIAFDQDFSPIGEAEIPDEYQVTSAFGSNRGLMILNIERFTDDRGLSIPYSVIRLK